MYPIKLQIQIQIFRIYYKVILFELNGNKKKPVFYFAKFSLFLYLFKQKLKVVLYLTFSYIHLCYPRKVDRDILNNEKTCVLSLVWKTFVRLCKEVSSWFFFIYLFFLIVRNREFYTILLQTRNMHCIRVIDKKVIRKSRVLHLSRYDCFVFIKTKMEGNL